MPRTRNALIGIWLATALVVAVALVNVYNSATRVPEFAGRAAPETIYSDPTVLFRDPGLLGTAVEMAVTRAVQECMAAAGFGYRGPVQIDVLRANFDPDREGYGIAAGADVRRPILGSGPSRSERPAYEQALYGASLASGSGTVGCAAAGRQALDAAVETLENLPYSIEQLENAARQHPAYQEALARWVECMDLRGYTVSSPEELIAQLATRLSRVSGDGARDLAAEERRTAADDFACRRPTIDAAIPEVASDLAPAFVEQNRPQLETLIPPPATELPAGLGTGDVQVTLIWNNGADLDLYVADPSGDVVYYANDTVASGGELDRDANYPCGEVSSPAAENVFWPTGQAPPGTYRAEVHFTQDCLGEGSTQFELIVRVRGQVVEQVRSTLAPDAEYELTFRVGS